MDILVWILLATMVITLSAWLVRATRHSHQSANRYQLKAESSQHQVPTVKPTQVASPEPREGSYEDLIKEVREKLRNKHDYGLWTWETRLYTERLLAITHPIDWNLLGLLTWYYIPWVNRRGLTNLLGASLSWVNTQYSVHDVLQDFLLRATVTQALTASVQEYLKMDDDPEITLNDRLYGIRPYSRDSITEEISKNIDRLVGPTRGSEFLQLYYRPDRDIKVCVLPEIPFEGIVNGNEVISFPTESTLCVEASTRGLRYLIFFFDKSPLCVCELHLIKLEDNEFGMLDYLLASYFIKNLQVDAGFLNFEQLQDSREVPTLAASWHSAVENSGIGTMILSRIDRMSGLEFEQFVGQLLRARGFEVEVTKGSGDYGIDVIAQKEGIKLAIQVKRQMDKVSRSAVSDAVAGKSYYHCDRAMVITNNYFHDSAIVLAHSTKCELIDRDTLELWITESQLDVN